MEKELTTLQADHDRLIERLQAVETSQDMVAADAQERAARASVERPRLKVVRVVPEEEAAGAQGDQAAPAPGAAEVSPDEDGPGRTTIQGSGSQIRAVPATSSGGGGAHAPRRG